MRSVQLEPDHQYLRLVSSARSRQTDHWIDFVMTGRLSSLLLPLLDPTSTPFRFLLFQSYGQPAQTEGELKANHFPCNSQHEAFNVLWRCYYSTSATAIQPETAEYKPPFLLEES